MLLTHVRICVYIHCAGWLAVWLVYRSRAVPELKGLNYCWKECILRHVVVVMVDGLVEQ